VLTRLRDGWLDSRGERGKIPNEHFRKNLDLTLKMVHGKLPW
jgi:hypothetical protein